jgi:hypothetical protein
MIDLIIWCAVICAIAGFAARQSPRAKPLVFGLCLLTPIAVSWAAAKWANSENQKTAENLLAGDFNKIKGLVKLDSFAFLYLSEEKYPSLKKGVCDDFCLRALISGKVKTFFISPQTPVAHWSPMMPMYAYRLEKHDTCLPLENSEEELGNNVADFSLLERSTDFRTSREVMIELLASGTCLVKEETTMATANQILILDDIAERFENQSFLFTRTSEIYRLTLHQKKEGQASFDESLRRTSLFYPVFKPFLVPVTDKYGSYTIRGGRRSSRRHQMSFWSTSRSVNGGQLFGRNKQIEPFLKKTLGIDLANYAAGVATPSSPTERVAWILDQHAVIGDAEGALINKMFQDIYEAQTITPEQARLLPRLYAIPTLKIPDTSFAAIGLTALNAPEQLPDIANGLFLHLDTILNRKKIDSFSLQYRFGLLYDGGIDRAMAALPAQELEKHGATIDRLAHDQIVRSLFPELLVAASTSGNGHGEMYTYLLRDGWDIYTNHYSYKEYGPEETVFAAFDIALKGLCKLGPSTPKAMPEILRLAEYPDILRRTGRWRNAFNALEAMGADTEAILKTLPYNPVEEKERENGCYLF